MYWKNISITFSRGCTKFRPFSLGSLGRFQSLFISDFECILDKLAYPCKSLMTTRRHWEYEFIMLIWLIEFKLKKFNLYKKKCISLWYKPGNHISVTWVFHKFGSRSNAILKRGFVRICICDGNRLNQLLGECNITGKHESNRLRTFIMLMSNWYLSAYRH